MLKFVRVEVPGIRLSCAFRRIHGYRSSGLDRTGISVPGVLGIVFALTHVAMLRWFGMGNIAEH